jgi:hypothetical protein
MRSASGSLVTVRHAETDLAHEHRELKARRLVRELPVVLADEQLRIGDDGSKRRLDGPPSGLLFVPEGSPFGAALQRVERVLPRLSRPALEEIQIEAHARHPTTWA